jgi:NarL family two-component system response regulator LiaR
VPEDVTIQQDSDRIQVLVVDDQAMVRSGLRYVLLAFEDLELIGEATTSDEALRLCTWARPDVVLMDLSVPGMDPVRVIRLIHRRSPATQIIALTGFWAQELVQAALKAGASAHAFKEISAEELVTLIRKSYASATPT